VPSHKVVLERVRTLEDLLHSPRKRETVALATDARQAAGLRSAGKAIRAPLGPVGDNRIVGILGGVAVANPVARTGRINDEGISPAQGTAPGRGWRPGGRILDIASQHGARRILIGRRRLTEDVVRGRLGAQDILRPGTAGECRPRGYGQSSDGPAEHGPLPLEAAEPSCQISPRKPAPVICG